MKISFVTTITRVDSFEATSIGLVSRRHALEMPVGPIYQILEDRYSERMIEALAEDLLPPGAVDVSRLDEGGLRVRPKYSIGRVVDRQAVRPSYRLLNQGLSVRAVHVCALDLRIRTCSCQNSYESKKLHQQKFYANQNFARSSALPQSVQNT